MKDNTSRSPAQVFPVHPVIDYSVRGICVRPYPGHPKGCPCFKKKDGCPPGAPKFDEYFDVGQPIFAIVNRFDLGSHRERMRTAHPQWSERQLVNCLYWQAGARKQLRLKIEAFLRDHPNYEANIYPEAMGVNITKTLKHAGLILEWPPDRYAHQIALAGILWRPERWRKSLQRPTPGQLDMFGGGK